MDCLFELMHPIRRSGWTFVGVKSSDSIAKAVLLYSDRLGKEGKRKKRL